MDPTEADYAAADRLVQLVRLRTGLSERDLKCPREKSFMTPCVARDGRLAVCSNVAGVALCVGCEHVVSALLEAEKAKHGAGA